MGRKVILGLSDYYSMDHLRCTGSLAIRPIKTLIWRWTACRR